jgi:hypothetical protein
MEEQYEILSFRIGRASFKGSLLFVVSYEESNL